MTKTYTAIVRVTHIETWGVDAVSEAEARQKFLDLTEDVSVDETGEETVDWQLVSMEVES